MPLFVIFLVLLIFALCKYKPKNFDRSMLFVLTVCTVCLGSKAIFILYYTLKDKNFTDDYVYFQDFINIVNMCVDVSLWMMLFSFVYEMNTVADVL
jgi:hypothetical protein